jgi:hypothetical protein
MANNNYPTVTLGGTVAKYALVKINSSGVGVVTGGVASEDNALVGIAQESGVSGDSITVRPIIPGTISDVLVGGAISLGARVYTAASGKGSATATSLTSVGIALLASTADGDIIPVIQTVGGNDDIS